MKNLIAAVLFAMAGHAYCDSVGFGAVVAVKQYDFGTDNPIKIYLDASSSDVNEACLENGKVYGRITPAKHEATTIDRMFSLATAAYMSGKKLRLHSENASCEVDFVALQESVF